MSARHASKASDIMITPEGMKDFKERKPETKRTDIEVDWRNTYLEAFNVLTLGGTSVLQLPQGQYIYGPANAEFQIATTTTSPTGASSFVPGFALINQYRVRFVGSSDAEFTFGGTDLFYVTMDYCETNEKALALVRLAGTTGVGAGVTAGSPANTQFVYAPLFIPPFSINAQADAVPTFDSTITNNPVQVNITTSTIAGMTGATGLSLASATLYARTGLYVDPEAADRLRKDMAGGKAKQLIPMKWWQSQSVNGSYFFTGPSMSISLNGFRNARCCGILIAAVDVNAKQMFAGNQLTSIQLVFQGITLINWPNVESDIVRLQLRDCVNQVVIGGVTYYWYFLPFSQIPANAWQKIEEMQNGKNFVGQTLTLTATSASSNQQQLFVQYAYDAFMRIEKTLTYIDF